MMNNILKYLTLTLILTLQLSAADSLKLMHPNGGEVFEAGTTTDILWEGIPDTSLVTIKFSSDNGRNWSVISESVSGPTEQWNIPFIESDSCLILISQDCYMPIDKPEIEWELSLGGSGADVANSIIQTSDGGYTIAGYSNSINGDRTSQYSNHDYWIVRINSNGKLVWEKSYGGSGLDFPYSIIQTNDKGYAIAGYSSSDDIDVTNSKGKSDYWIVKLTPDGELEWEKSFGGSNDDVANSIIQTSDSGYLIAGYSLSYDGDITNPKGNTDYWIIKLSANGELDWEKSFGGTWNDAAQTIIQLADSGFAVIGYSSSINGDITNPKGNSDIWIIKLTPDGELEWEKSLGGSGIDIGYSVVQTKDKGFAIAGSTSSIVGNDSKPKGGINYYVAKLSSNSDIVWEKSFGGNNIDVANSIIQAYDNSFVVSGYSNSSGKDITESKGNNDYWVIRLSEKGELEWEKSLGGFANEYSGSIIQSNDCGFIVAGNSSSSEGDVISPKGSNDYWLVKLSSSSSRSHQFDYSDDLFTIYKNSIYFYVYNNNQSNSANAVVILEEDTEITIDVFDVLGRRIVELYSGLAKEGRSEYRINYNDFQSGRYFIRLTTPSETKTEIIEILW